MTVLSRPVTALADALGGYLESSTVGTGGRSYRWAEYTIRVPAAQFQSFLDQAGDLAHVTWQNTDLQNITETYYDTEGRLKTQQIKAGAAPKAAGPGGEHGGHHYH